MLLLNRFFNKQGAKKEKAKGGGSWLPGWIDTGVT
jgi:hypothetical protein